MSGKLEGRLLSEVANTRVLKIHVDAVEEALPEARAAMAVTGDVRVFSQILATAAVTAADGMTRYTAAVSGPRGVWIYGPFATYAAAEKAVAKGLPVDAGEGSRVGIFPLIPAPKKTPSPRSRRTKE